MNASNATAADASAPAALHRPTVLVVEDDDDVRAEVSELLRLEGYAVTEAADGMQALKLLRREPHVDVVLLDLWLPHMDGWTFRAEQRADQVIRNVPVVVMTADSSSQARAIDADEVIRKPFGASHLCSTIRRVLADRGAEAKCATELVSETVSLLVGAVGHEVANPLMALIAGLEGAREDSSELRLNEAGARPNETGPPSVEQMLDQCWRIADALRTLRGLPCPPWTHEGSIDVDHLVRSAIARASTEAVRISFEGGTDAWVRGDPLVVLYLCTALIRNAIEAVPSSRSQEQSKVSQDPDVDVRLRRTTDEVILDVRDRGAPIPEDDLARIFALDNPGRERAWGAGLRLWFVRQVVEGLAGAIEVSNHADGGVVCRVRMPASSTPPDPVSRDPEAASA